MTLFDAAIRSVLKHEGGYVNNPRDPGGETNWGISKRAYPSLDIRNLTREAAIEIYRRDYWSKVPADLPDDVRWFAFDTCVNSGEATMRRLLALDDSLIGLAANRLKFLTNLTTWESFGKGWTRRVAGVLDDIRAWQATRAHDNDMNAPHVAHTVVLHNFPLAIRWAVLTSAPAELRGGFVWRTRDGKLDVRHVKQ